MQAARRAGFDAGRLKPCADAIRAERALVDLLGLCVEARNVERAARYAILAADAVLLLKIDDAVGVLNNRPIRRTGAQASWVCAVHALILAHQPHQVAV